MFVIPTDEKTKNSTKNGGSTTVSTTSTQTITITNNSDELGEFLAYFSDKVFIEPLTFIYILNNNKTEVYPKDFVAWQNATSRSFTRIKNLRRYTTGVINLEIVPLKRP